MKRPDGPFDLCGVKYKENRYAPGQHVSPVKAITGGSTQVPVLKTSEIVISDSTKILEFLQANSQTTWKPYTEDPEKLKECKELEEWFDQELGPHTRRIAYYHLLQYPSLFFRCGLGKTQLSYLEVGIAYVATPFIGLSMSSGSFKVTQPETNKSIQTVLHLFSKVEEILEKQPFSLWR